MRAYLAAAAALVVLSACASAPDAPSSAPEIWRDQSLDADTRADAVLAAMTQEEKLTLVTGLWGSPQPWTGWQPPEYSRNGAAGVVPGIERLGIPPQWQADAGMGVAQQGAAAVKTERTSLPSGLAVAATWNPDVAFRGGAMIGSEARASGFNVHLAGGVNLVREPRSGRNFESGGEDPLLAGVMVGAAVRGIQSNNIIATVKHYALNDQETGRGILNVVIDDSAARMSDLLAFQIAIEQSQAASVMCAYNRVGGDYSCENDYLLNQVLKRDWDWPGYVMSDWGATHSTVEAATRGLDQENGVTFDRARFGANLASAIEAGQVPQARLDDMARRILRGMFATGLYDNPVEISEIDAEANARVSQAAAEEAIVLLRNRGDLLPLSADVGSIALIGAHADVGVLTGGGSAQVYPRGGNAAPGVEPTSWPGPVVFIPNSPMAAIQRHAPNADVRFDAGANTRAAARLARQSDVAIVFVTQWTSESRDYSLTLSDNQDALVRAVAAANPRTIVVMQTGGAVFMPWLTDVGAVLEAWYPGERGGDAIANVLFGAVNPSGHLPITFPRALDQLPRPTLDGEGLAQGVQFDVTYSEGAAIGYRWFAGRDLDPVFPFGHGLSYTTFQHFALSAQQLNGDLRATFVVRNTGQRAGADVAQVYVGAVSADAGWEAPVRLGGWVKVNVAPGAQMTTAVTIDLRLLATYDSAQRQWRIAAGEYRVMLGSSARDIAQTIVVRLPERTWRDGS